MLAITISTAVGEKKILESGRQTEISGKGMHIQRGAVERGVRMDLCLWITVLANFISPQLGCVARQAIPSA